MGINMSTDSQTDYAEIFKALSDPNRLLVLELLGSGEQCACTLLESMHINQSTLSHHMKILCSCGLVCSRKVGKWTHYAINPVTYKHIKNYLSALTNALPQTRSNSCN